MLRTAALASPAPSNVGAPGLPTRLLAAVRANALDRAVGDGEDPARSRPLARRAAHLTSPRHRVRLAEGVERLARSASSRSRSVVGGEPRALSANRDRLAELAALLRDGAPVDAAGVARLRLLLTDPCSPAHAGDAAALAGALDGARRAMVGYPEASPATDTGPARGHTSSRQSVSDRSTS
jgi:hypothetical protein